MDDLISRQAAIDAIENAFDRETILNRFVRKIAISAVRLLPSVLPEIVRCKDCLMHGSCRFEQGLGLDGYCSQAERRIDG